MLAADDLTGRGRLRITVTGGRSPLGSDRGDDGPTVVVVSDELGEWPATTAAATVPWPRNERGAVAGLKTTSYAENVVALDVRARARRAARRSSPTPSGCCARAPARTSSW